MPNQNKISKSTKSGTYKRIFFIVLAIALILLFSWWMIQLADKQLRNDFRREASTVASTIDLNRLKALSGTKADLQSPDYLKLKEKFANAKEAHEKSKYIYLLGQKADGTVFFFVDDVPAGSKNESPPGQVYEEASANVINSFKQKQAVTLPAETDRWGTFITALVPVWDPSGGKLIAVFGMDVDITSWNAAIFFKAVPWISLFSILTILLFSAFLAPPKTDSSSVKPIHRRLLIPIILTLIFLPASFCVVLIRLQNENLNQLSQDVFQRISYEFNQLIVQQSDSMAGIADLILQDKNLIEALTKKDKQYLLKKYVPLLNELHEDYGISNLYFHLPDRKNLLRVHSPEQAGDSIDRFTLTEAARTGRKTSGIEVGSMGTFILRVVKPIYEKGRIIAYLELGKGMSDIISVLHNKYDVELTVIIHKRALEQTSWEHNKKTLGRESSWDKYPNIVVVYSSLQEFPTAYSNFIEEKHAYYVTDRKMRFNDKSWAVMVSPLVDVSGVNIGDLIISKNISKEKLALKQFSAIVIGCAALFMAVLFGFLYIALRQAEQSIRKQQFKLSENEKRFKDIAEISSDWIWEIDLENRYTYLSDGVEKTLGYKTDEMLGKTPFDFMHPKEIKRVKSLFKGIRQNQDYIVEMENYHMTKSGNEVYMLTNGVPILDEKGEVKGYRGVDKDITGRKKALEAQEKLSAFLQQRVKSLECLREQSEIMEEKDLTIEKLCQRTLAILRKVFRYPEKTCAKITVGKTEYKSSNFKESQCYLYAAIEQFGKLEINCLEYEGNDSSDAFLQEEYDTVYIVAKSLSKAIDRIYTANALLAAKDKAECANRAKSEFIANISHDTRTPLNGILGITAILLNDKDITCSQREHLKDIHSSGEILLAIINDILDISKIESDKIEIENKPFNLKEELKLICALQKKRALKKEIEFTYEYASGTPDMISGDSLRIKQIIMGLLNNAVKFTNKGRISLQVSSQRKNQKESIFSFEITDTGVGIKDEHKARIFEKFMQADSSTTRKYGGSGLGLFICKQLVEMMGGNIVVESKEKIGSKFKIDIPLEVCKNKQTDAQPENSRHNLKWKRNPRILVAEDSTINHKVTEFFLKSAGCISDKAWNGLEAVEKFKQNDYDLIYMDVHMPELDGLEATRKIRKIEEQDKLPAIIIIALSASAMSDEQKECSVVGMNDFLSKPLNEKSLKTNLEKYLPHLLENQEKVSNVDNADSQTDTDALKQAKENFLKNSMMGEDFYDQMIEEFKVSLNENIQKIQTCLGSGDLEQLAKAAHLIKGEASTLKLEQISTLCLNLEMAGKEASPEKAQKALDELDKAIKVQL